MAIRPDFSKAQLQRLQELGCEPEQITQLRYALTTVRRVLYTRAARNDVKATLETVAEHADALLKELGMIAMQTSAARAEANAMIKEAYWQAFPDDDGPWSEHHMLPRLDAIAKGARAGIEKLPKEPTRNRTASPLPVARIDDALLYGWSKTHCHVHHVREDTPAAWAAWAKAHPPAGPYPKKFDASGAAARRDGGGNVFREIVGICYEVAGAPAGTDPLRAIRAYLQSKRSRRKELRKGLDAAITITASRKRNRTSPKS